MQYLKNSALWVLSKVWKYKFVLLFLLMAMTIYKGFVDNYQFQSPIVSKRAETFTQVSNDRAIISQDLETCKAEKQAAIEAGNADLFTNNK